MTTKTGVWAALLALLCGCGADPEPIPEACVGPLEIGDPAGHADPFGARAAGEARAARIDAGQLFPPPAHGRHPIRDGDYVLVNEHIAVVIEGARLSDGYGRFGGEILAIDRVGDDGLPLGLSRYGETLIALGLGTVDPASVTVLHDGSDGGEAVVRVEGTTRPIPFVAQSLGALFAQYSLGIAIDYVLAPGEEKLAVRMSILNRSPQPVDFGVGKKGSNELFGYFHTNQNQIFTPERAFDTGGAHDWVGFVSEEWSFAWRAVDGPLHYGLDVSGFYLFHGPAFVADGCAITTSDRTELFAGGPELDGLREAMRRSDGSAPWRAIAGVVEDDSGAPVADAFVHALDEDDLYLSRTKTDAEGRFVIHAPEGGAANLAAQKRGFPVAWQMVAAAEGETTVTLAAHGTIHVAAEDEGGTPLPVRIQVVPAVPVPGLPESFGVLEERNDRLYQEFAITGEASLVVPPGEHRVIVSRGYEYEIVDTTVTVAGGETVEVLAELAHSVDTSGVMCADFHIHSFLSADSSDPIVHKVKGAVADGLDIPVSSEHEWVVDFGPVVSELGLDAWAFGSSSSELTTFSWGHFGVVPLRPRPGALNNGAIDWIGKSPAEVFAEVDALEEKPALVVNHPRSTGIGGYFSAAELAKDGTSTSVLWSENFDAIEAFNNSDFESNRAGTVNDWFQLLARGKRVVAIGNSDSHHLRSSPVGYPRTCFFFGHDDPKQLSDLAIRDAVLGGDSVVSGGLYLTVTGPGGARPGSSVPNGPGDFSVVVQSPSWVPDATSLEVIVRGATVDTLPLSNTGPGPAKRYEQTVSLSLAPGDFVVFHARSEGDLSPVHPGRRPFAVSNPIFVD